MRANHVTGLVAFLGCAAMAGVSYADDSAPQSAPVDQAQTDAAIKDLSNRLNGARAVPHFDSNGQPDGYTTVPAQPSGTFQKLGLKNGDVITGVNGQPVNDPAHAFKMLQRTKEMNHVEIVRDGQSVTAPEERQPADNGNADNSAQDK